MPCWQQFERQANAYRDEVLGTAPRFAIEAASPFGWQRYVADQERIIAIDRFGFSGPGAVVYDELGLTPAKIAQRVADSL